jgi:signal transduction histidine kinase/ActR/RegA family two-component response regulator
VITTALHDESGQLRWFAQITQDITELKQKTIELEDSNRLLVQTLDELHRTQRELVQHERLRALGQMATGIAHDFNNALTPILGFSELLLARPGDLKDTERVAQYLGLIHANAEAAARIVGRLRDFYRYREDNEALAPVDLNRVIRRVIELTRPKWQNEALAQGVTIQLETDFLAASPVMGQEAELSDAITGLVLNAVDAVTRKGQSGRLRLATQQENEHVAVVVSDTGTGMSSEVREHCFEPFFSTKTDHGSGLGLALVYGVVNRHGGMITLEGEEGQGTTVTLRFPAHRAGEPVVPEKIALAKSGPLRILIVDDDPGVRDVTAEYLREDHHAIDQAASGREALEKLEIGTYDMVITDKAMPGMSGCQLAIAIKKTHPHLPVLLITGFGDMMNSVGEKPAGVDLVLGKPLSMDQLRQAVAQFCGKSSD